MSDRQSFYFKKHKHFFKPLFDCFLTCSIIKVTCNININNFGLHLKVFTLLTVYILLCLTNKLFVDVAYKYLISGKYLNKSYMSLSVLVHFLLFTIYLMYSFVRMVLSAVLKFSSFILSLFFTSLTPRIFIVLLFLTCTHILFNNNFLASKNFIKNYVNTLKKLYGPFLWMGFNCLKATATSRGQFTFYHSVNRHPTHLIYDTNVFDNNFNFFNMFLINFNSSVEFAICSGIPSGGGPNHMESSPPICNINQLPQFYMVGDLSGGYSQTDHKFNFNTNFNVTVDSYMDRSFNFSFSQFPLIAVLVFFKVKIRKALPSNIVSSEDLLKLNNL